MNAHAATCTGSWFQLARDQHNKVRAAANGETGQGSSTASGSRPRLSKMSAVIKEKAAMNAEKPKPTSMKVPEMAKGVPISKQTGADATTYGRGSRTTFCTVAMMRATLTISARDSAVDGSAVDMPN